MDDLKPDRTFRLDPDGIPSPRGLRRWKCILRWLVTVMNDDDRRLPFVCGVLGQSAKRNFALSPKQAEVCTRIMNAVVIEYDAGALDCQRLRDTSSSTINRVAEDAMFEGIDMDKAN